MSVNTVVRMQDYTLIHYDVNAWEGKAYAYGLQWLREAGCPVEGLKFDPDLVIRGLIVDKQLGNLVKVDRFGYEFTSCNNFIGNNNLFFGEP